MSMGETVLVSLVAAPRFFAMTENKQNALTGFATMPQADKKDGMSTVAHIWRCCRYAI
jgi:hypothetical protein